ncbi:MAG: aldo/keto reductase [Euryarchaeota archaeon]|nr:aldo/keto reductase [Euryarchaeota archaeon]MBH33675.1 aldo/keto reductase [Euryarchaeota archaeon]|tara:strand:- start:615 stop:1463 length:849 start_codon:yes stop_codon:yes gene_type:complete
MEPICAINREVGSGREIASIEIPRIGLGVWMMNGPNECKNAVINAISIGYRMIDTARSYGNEEEVGEAIRESGIDRSEITVVTKLRRIHAVSYESAIEHCGISLEKLGIDKIDLYLVHAPPEDPDAREPVWRAMEDLLEAGLVKTIGVSNYGVNHLHDLKSYAKILPCVNQVELNPWIQRPELHSATREIGAITMAYSPLARGQKANDPEISEISKKIGCTGAQAAIRWCLDQGAVVIPKSSNPSRQQENLESMGVNIDQVRNEIDLLDSNHVSGWDPTVEP